MTIDLRYGDTIEQMKLIPDKSIDFICCDLPYGSTKNHWDIVIPFEQLCLPLLGWHNQSSSSHLKLGAPDQRNCNFHLYIYESLLGFFSDFEMKMVALFL